MRVTSLSAGLILAICLTSPAKSAQVSVVTYVCNIEGAQAQLTAQVQAVSPAGVFLDSSGMFGGSVPTNEVNYHYQGTLVSPTT